MWTACALVVSTVLGFVLGRSYAERKTLRQLRRLFQKRVAPGLEDQLRDLNAAHLDAIKRLHEPDYWGDRDPTPGEIFQAWKDMHSIGAIRESLVERHPSLDDR